MNHEKRSITRTESQGRGRGITIKVVSLKPRPLDTQLIVKIIHMSDKYEVKSLTISEYRRGRG